MNANEEARHDEYRRRATMFQEFVEALRKWETGGCSVLTFEDGDDPEVVTFRYRGNKLRIKHSFKPEDHPQILGSEKPKDAARLVPSKLELLEAREHPDKDVCLASLEGIDADWRVTVPANKDENPHGLALSKTLYIAEKPQAAFEELVTQWHERTKTNT